ncbi:SDR family NAD(P)-dependent oxidoreductase [Conexibacter arvalis]|uniref:NAD(P)-dependent dehydrogenase (Short-subunit alcohol dehydrogenase family) n=1 Tax=Conexibacter arvalis TaxID=912552 RepID=A0A840IB45_9ACTN|nr:SDR family NAD(P)-dependent oxidoreductase [Conexibacter arvalis]MBB4661852.1 NAD(P)-dependent dehydrogenase (short-subunit alcohol dehydrogenase family) [Conexibacter arvalis]
MTRTSDDTPGRVWLITGASRGLGRAFAEAALAAGDRVVAIARSAEQLDRLAAEHCADRVLPLPADVTDRAAVFAAVERAVARFGRLDVVVNNAGTMWLGAVEEFGEQEARAAMEVNFFGALWVTQAVAPHLRAQGDGRLLQISSVGGVASGPTAGLYSAGKFALEGMSEALAQELAPFGVRVTIVEPGGYWTDLYRSGLRYARPLDAYAPLREAPADGVPESKDSEPEVAAEAVMTLVDSDDPPLRLVLGSAVLDAMIDVTRRRIETWERWEEVSRAAERAVPMPDGYLDV